MKHPIQPTEKDAHGVMRFKVNAIVKFLLEAGPYDMNSLALMNFTDEDREQFAQLIGYSVSGFSELPYASDEALELAASYETEPVKRLEQRIVHLENVLMNLRQNLRQPIADLYGIHPDDLR